MTVEKLNKMIRQPIDYAVNPFGGSVHEVAGRTSPKENPHLQRLARFARGYANDFVFIAHSPHVTAWFRELDKAAQPTDAGETLSEHARRPVQLLNPDYRTHAQRMAELYRAADRANARKAPLVWTPITAERAERVRLGVNWDGAPRSGYSAEWTEKRRAAVVELAAKRGDIFTLAERIIDAG